MSTFRLTIVNTCMHVIQMNFQTIFDPKSHTMNSHSQCKMLMISLCLLTFALHFRNDAGSSVRDDCLYSTSTQKQSFDSMTISQCHTTKMSIDYDLSNQYGDINKITVMPKPKLLRSSSSGGGGGGKVCRFQKRMFNEDQQQQQQQPPQQQQQQPHEQHSNHDNSNEKHDKSHEIRISINCTNRMKPKSESKLIRFFQNIVRWRLHSRHIGYYSPRTNHSIDTINVRLNPVVVVTNNDAHQISERNFGHFDHSQRSAEDDQDNDSISNSSLRDDNETAIKDELAAYMDELRLREIR